MTNSSNESVCPNCGGALEVRRKGSTQGLYCTNCDWSVVTSLLPEILGDQTKYEVTAIGGDFRNDHHLKAIAQLLATNRLAARKLLQEPGGLVAFSGLAHDVMTVRDTLLAAELAYKIDPPFPW